MPGVYGRQLELPIANTAEDDSPFELDDALSQLNHHDCGLSLKPSDGTHQESGEPDEKHGMPRLPAKPELLNNARTLANAISERLDKPVRLFVTDNRSTMVSFRRIGNLLILRVHHMFLSAPQEIIEAIANYAQGDKSVESVIDNYVRKHNYSIRVGHPRSSQQKLDPRGAIFNLKTIFDNLNTIYFGGRIRARIGWGRGNNDCRRLRRTIRMGVYDHSTRTIRLHPALDRAEVPQFFVEYVVFHEMLHQAVPSKDNGGRKQHHSPEFRAKERAYPDYQKAIAWEKANLPLLLARKPAVRYSEL